MEGSLSLQLQVLGFAGAAPLQGACSSYAVSDRERVVLLDCGPGALERVWRFGLLEKLEAIVLSHMHLDHMLDLLLFAGELVREHTGERRPALHVPAEVGPAVLTALDSVFSTSAINRFKAAFELSSYSVGDKLWIGDLTLSFAPTAHTTSCFAIRVSDGRSSLVYGADGGPGIDRCLPDLYSWPRSPATSAGRASSYHSPELMPTLPRRPCAG